MNELERLLTYPNEADLHWETMVDSDSMVRLLYTAGNPETWSANEQCAFVSYLYWLVDQGKQATEYLDQQHQLAAVDLDALKANFTALGWIFDRLQDLRAAVGTDVFRMIRVMYPTHAEMFHRLIFERWHRAQADVLHDLFGKACPRGGMKLPVHDALYDE